MPRQNQNQNGGSDGTAAPSLSSFSQALAPFGAPSVPPPVKGGKRRGKGRKTKGGKSKRANKSKKDKR